MSDRTEENEAAAEAERKRREERQQRRDQAWDDVLNTWQGRLVLHEIMSEFGLFNRVFAPNVGINHNAVMHDAAISVKEKIDAADPVAFMKLYQENNDV